MTATAAPTKKILLVDDDSQIRSALARRLINQGMQVVESVDGVEGLDAMNQEVFDCIVLDLKMPRKNGTEVLSERVNTLNAHTPVCVLTSMPSDDASDRAKELGADCILSKSATSPSEVVATVKQYAVR